LQADSDTGGDQGGKQYNADNQCANGEMKLFEIVFFS
jgi:hypothetical protein